MSSNAKLGLDVLLERMFIEGEIVKYYKQYVLLAYVGAPGRVLETPIYKRKRALIKKHPGVFAGVFNIEDANHTNPCHLRKLTPDDPFYHVNNDL